MSYHKLADTVPVADASALVLPRARDLFDAVSRHRDYKLLEMYQRQAAGVESWEFLIVEVKCDEVPSRNTVGINFRERLALCVPADSRKLVQVLALRKDFPVLMHQNQGHPGEAANLCLYFELADAVHRTWTPQSFLRRIQWWLEMSARGLLHPADQPVEQLFFSSPYELVLPWNIDALRESPTTKFELVRLAERSEGVSTGLTFLLRPIQSNVKEAIGEVDLVELTLDPVVHGFIESDPPTLGQLSDILTRRGADLPSKLKELFRETVGDQGRAATSDRPLTVILLHIPVCRSADEQPSSVVRRAFLVPIGGLALGEALGALFSLENKYFRVYELTETVQSDAWREFASYAMSVLHLNTAKAARTQSGLQHEGPRGVLIGAGSLGSAMLNIWSRSGWGEWTVVDKDHVKPHNLSRHAAYAAQIGAYKAHAVAALHEAAVGGASHVKPLVVDATRFELPAVKEVLSGCELVVDASTTLEYPRAASADDTLARHASVFLTPDGNGGVLLAEDPQRGIRLRTLEAQYYRSLIQNDWGAIHLGQCAASFWSGASCRDISVVMPYSRVMNHASTLAEQIQSVPSTQSALIKIWQRNPLRGSVEVHDVPALPEKKLDIGPYTLFFDEGLELELRDLRMRSLPSETGGVLLGYYDFNISAVFVVAALPAPIDSKASPVSFERGVAGLTESVAEASRRTAGMVRYVGEWHSHPRGHSAAPSTDDMVQLVHLTLGMSDDGLPAVQLIVGETDIQVLQGVMG